MCVGIKLWLQDSKLGGVRGHVICLSSVRRDLPRSPARLDSARRKLATHLHRQAAARYHMIERAPMRKRA